MTTFLERLKAQNPAMLYLGLGGATLILLIAAVVGALRVGGKDISVSTKEAASAPAETGAAGLGAGEPSSAAPGTTTTGSRTTAATAPKGTVARTGIAAKDLVSTAGATRIGVTATEIRWGLHAPKTFDGAPLPLADAPLKGVGIYLKQINDAGGVNGRKVIQYFADDRYTVEGAKTAADDILTDKKVFFASGTLGVDQVATVASAARNTLPSTPYMAAGGSEADFKTIGMFQIAGSYDTHLIMLAQFLAKEVKKPACLAGNCTAAQSIYGGVTKVGAVELDSKYIHGSVVSLQKALQANGLEWVGAVKVGKYTDTSNTHQYQSQCLELGSKGAQIVVPATDPLTTQLMVAQCPGVGQVFKWTMSDFAHDSDTALKLMGNSWTGVRGLSGGCYYNVYNDPKYAGKCGALKKAHDDWLKVNDETDWTKDGQGGISGYQLTHFWLKALKDAGDDLTRERFTAALSSYQNYDDLVTSPITFLNVPNIAHGIELMSVYEATAQTKWSQFSDGLVGSF